MEKQNIISVSTFCTQYNVPVTFIQSLREYDLLEIVREGEEEYIQVTHLHRVEKMIRLHYELNINMEGLDVVNNLLQQVWDLQQENQSLKDRLKLFE